MPLEVIIFDMDGVLVDSEIYWEQSRVEYAQDRDKVWTDAFQREAMGQSTIGWANVMQNRLHLSETTDQIIAEMKQRVIDHYEQRMPTRPGALEAVQLAARHYRVGLASGSPTEIIQQVMRLTGLDKVFEVIVYGDTVPQGKPAPDIYLEALDRLQATSQVALGIEDSANGIRSLKAAGMYSIAAPSPGFPLSTDVLALADAHITEMTEFTLDLLHSISENNPKS